MAATADFFIKNLANSLENQSDLARGKMDELMLELNTLRKEYAEAKQGWSQQLSSSEGERSQYSAIEAALREQL